STAPASHWETAAIPVCSGAMTSRTMLSGPLMAARGSDVRYDNPARTRRRRPTANPCHLLGLIASTSFPGRASKTRRRHSLPEPSGTDQHPLHHVKVLQSDPRADGNGTQSV